MISLRPSLITEHHSVSSLGDPAREASPSQGISAQLAMWTRPAPCDVTFTSRWRQRSERDEPRTYSADASVDHTSITPKSATTSLAASVDPTDAQTGGTSVETLLLKPRRHQPGDPVLRDSLSVQGSLWLCGEYLADHRAARAVVLPPPPDDVERLANSLEQDGRGPVRRPSSVSRRVVSLARGGFRRLCSPQHGTQRGLAERLAQCFVSAESRHDFGRIVRLRP